MVRRGRLSPPFIGLVGLASGLATLLPGNAALALCPAELGPQVEAMVNQAPLDKAYVGLVVQTQAAQPQNRRTLVARYGDRLFIPASNVKLLTTAAALHRLGPTYRIRTSIYGSVAAGGLASLRLVGRGDPTLTNAQIEALADQVVQAGVTQINRLVVEDAYFPGGATNPTWEWDDAQWAYGAPVNGLILNRNAVAVQISPTQPGQPLWIDGLQALPAGAWPVTNDSLTVATDATIPLSLWRRGDSPVVRLTGQMTQGAAPKTYELAVLNPAEQFAVALAAALTRRSRPVQAVVISQTATATAAPELAALQSPPLAALLIPANRDSDNLYAEALFKTLGVVTATTPPIDASEAGGAAVKAALADLGVRAEELRLADGSGLSRHNLVTPLALVETLQAMAVHPQAQVFRDSLAVAGVSGTLKPRLVNTPLVGRVQGKSGALTGQVTLSGYLQPPAYEPLVFSLLINQANVPARVLRERIDALLLLLAQLSSDC